MNAAAEFKSLLYCYSVFLVFIFSERLGGPDPTRPWPKRGAPEAVTPVYTETHQVAINVSKQGGGEKVSRMLETNDIILNMNMLPHEALSRHDHARGLTGDDRVAVFEQVTGQRG